MRFRFSFCLAILVCSLSLATPAQAGQIFPPSNLHDPSQNCPNGELLAWIGAFGNCPMPGPDSRRQRVVRRRAILERHHERRAILFMPILRSTASERHLHVFHHGIFLSNRTDNGRWRLHATHHGILMPAGRAMGFNSNARAHHGRWSMATATSASARRVRYSTTANAIARQTMVQWKLPGRPPRLPASDWHYDRSSNDKLAVGQTYYGVMTNGVFQTVLGSPTARTTPARRADCSSTR